MTETADAYPGTAETISEAPYSGETWQNINNIKAEPDWASIVTSLYDTGVNSYVMKATNFSFSVPVGSTIDGIRCKIYVIADSLSRWAKDVLVQLTKNNTARVGDNKATNAQITVNQLMTYGGATDLWGTTWTPEEVNASTFGVHIAHQATVDNCDTAITWVRITVYYTEGSSGRRRSSAVWMG